MLQKAHNRTLSETAFFIRLLTETGECGGWRYPQFLAPDGALSLGAIAIGLLTETSFVLIINSLKAKLDTETDFYQPRQVCNLAMLHKANYSITN